MMLLLLLACGLDEPPVDEAGCYTDFPSGFGAWLDAACEQLHTCRPNDYYNDAWLEECRSESIPELEDGLCFDGCLLAQDTERLRALTEECEAEVGEEADMTEFVFICDSE